MNKFLLKKILLSLIGFSTYFLVMLFSVLSVGFFLDTIGSQGMPVVLSFAAVMAIIYYFLFSYLSTRVPVARFYYLTVLLVAGLLSVNFFGLEDPGWIAILFYFVANFMHSFAYVSISYLCYSLVSPLQGKSVVPIVEAASAFGKILGSVAASYLWIRQGDLNWPLMLIVALILIAALVALVQRLFGKDEMKFQIEAERDEKTNTHSKDTKESIEFILKKSPLFRDVALYVFLSALLLVIVEFKFLNTLNHTYSGGQLTMVLGAVYGFQNGLCLLINLFITRFVLFRFGVANIILFFPFSALLVYAVMTMLGMPPMLVIVFALLVTIVYAVLASVSVSQALSLVPKKINRSVFLLIKGVVMYVSRLAGSLYLLLYTFNIKLEKTVNTAFIALIILALIYIALRIRTLYFLSLQANLESGEEDQKIKAIELLAEKTNRGRGESLLRNVLSSSHASEKAKFRTMDALGIIGNLESVVDLTEIVKSGTPRQKRLAIENINKIVKNRRRFRSIPLTRRTLLEAYENILVGNDPVFVKTMVISSLKYFHVGEVIQFLEKQLKSEDLDIRVNAIETLGSFKDRGIITYLKPLLDHPDKRIVKSVVIALWPYQDLRIQLLSQMVEIFNGSSLHDIESSLIIISRLKISWEKKLAEKNLSHSVPYIRALACLAMIHLGESKYLTDFALDILLLGQNSEQLDYVLSQYREFDDRTKAKFLDVVRLLDSQSIDKFKTIFGSSAYNFNKEVEALQEEARRVVNEF